KSINHLKITGRTLGEAMPSKPATARRARRTQADRREVAERALLDAAISLIAKRGVKGMTLADVGEGTGYSKGIAPHYFRTKERLLVATTQYVHELYLEGLAGRSSRPGLETLMQMAEIACSPP